MKLTEVDYGIIVWGAMVLLFAISIEPAVRHPAVAATMPSSSEAIGTFMDHRGDGAIEFRPCGAKLCGHVVWVRDGAPAEACGTEIIGDAAPVRDGVWDGGWILDPELGQKFDVEITKLGDEELQVMGYLGSKDLSETFLWKKAPDSLKRCQTRSDVALAPGD